MLLSKTLRLFLDSIGRREEYEFYLEKFQSDRSVSFALVMPDLESVRESADLMTFDLQFLLRLELCPLVFLEGAEAEEKLTRLTRHGPYRVLDRESLEAEDSHWRDVMADCVRGERIPVLCGGPDGPGVLELVPRLARRLHLIRGAGMLHTREGERVEVHVTRRHNGHELKKEDEAVVERARQWLESEPALHISVSSPLYLLQELFTVRGRGTIIRPGSMIHHHTSVRDVDVARLVELVERAFRKPLRDPASLSAACDLYLESRYRGAVVLEPHEAGKYLSKFIVGTEARGEGVAQELWEAVRAEQPRLFWRSRPENPVNQWYERQADGLHRDARWTVFWRGIEPGRLPGVIAYCLGRESDFVE